MITKVIYNLLHLVIFFKNNFKIMHIPDFVCSFLQIETTAGYNGQRYRCPKSFTRKSYPSTTRLRRGCQSQSGGEHKVNEGKSGLNELVYGS